MPNLLIVESPAKCQKIRSFLGADWTVCATMGHLRALEESLEAIGLGTDWKPRYHWLKEKAKAIQQLKAAASVPDTQVYLAADDDREGEMIAYSVRVLLRLPDTTPRIVFHEITEKAIRHAIENPRLLDMNRVHAQETRAMLDMMIGFTISPLLWKNVAPTLSAGRCQTPALRLVIEREETIESFVAARSWSVQATWTVSIASTASTASTAPMLHTTMVDELEDEASVQYVLEHAHVTPGGRITDKDIRQWSESAPPPLITSTLQQQASQLYHCSPKQTMCIAQRLYEAGHITYMRTDKAVMSDEAKDHARTWVRENVGEEYLAPDVSQAPHALQKKVRKPRTAKKEEKKEHAQEAHEAIRPTHLEVTILSVPEWGPTERNIYQLISRRALQSIMADAHGERCRITVQMDGLEDFPWVSEQKRTIFEGWRRLGHVAEIEDAIEEEEKEPEWAQWTVGSTLTWTHLQGIETETKSHTRYTEASLVRELEKHGIGRPSTFASLLSVIQDKKYVVVQDIPARPIQLMVYDLTPGTWPYHCQTVQQTRGGEKRKLAPTPLGRSVWEWLVIHFNDLFAYEFTATMEQSLDQIATGLSKEKEILEQTWGSYQERYHALMSSSASSTSSASSSSSSSSSSSVQTQKQKIYKDGIKAVQTKKGPLLLREGKKDATQFFGWPKGISWDKMTEEGALKHIQQEEQQKQQKQQKQPKHYMEWQDKPVLHQTGRYGPYLQWDTISIPFLEGETHEETVVRLEKKIQPVTDSLKPISASLKETTQYIIRSGQYGPYITKKTKTKTDKTKPLFISVPKGLAVESLTDKEIDAIFKAGVEQKQRRKKTLPQNSNDSI